MPGPVGSRLHESERLRFWLDSGPSMPGCVGTLGRVIDRGAAEVYGLIGKIVAVPGKRDELAGILTGMGEMQGCRSYVVATVADEPNALWVTEVWESAEAHADSLALPEVEQAVEAGRPLIAGFGSRVETTPIGGIGIGD